MGATIFSSISLRGRFFVLLMSVFFFSGSAWGSQWAKTYRGTGDDLAGAIGQTINGGYIIAGSTDSFGNGGYDALVLKLDLNGGIIWQKTYGGLGDDSLVSIRQNANGGFIMAGKTGSFGAGGDDVWLLRLYSDGTIRWQYSYGGSRDDYAGSIWQTSDGGYVVAGSTKSFDAGGYDIWVLRLYPDGTIRWQKTYGGVGDDYGKSIQQTLDGGYIVAGSTNSFGTQGNDMWVLKLDAGGNIQWQKTYGGSGDDYAYSVKQTMKTMGIPDGYIVAGKSYSFGLGDADSLVIKLDLNGNIQWQKTYGGSGGDYANSIQQTSDGGYIMSGGAGSFVGDGTELSAAFLLKLNGVGDIEWQKYYHEGYGNSAGFVEQTSDGSYVVAGSTESLTTGVNDVLLLKVHGNGDIAGCPNIKTLNAGANGTSARVNTTGITGVDTFISPIATTVSPKQRSLTAELVCDANLTLYTPKGGEIVPSGAMYTIEWGSGVVPAKFDLLFSMDDGVTWLPIASKITGMSYDWQVPALTETSDKCFVKLIGYDSSDAIVGEVISDFPFTIDVLNIIQPNGGETLTSGTVYTMLWHTGTLSPIAKENLYYTDNGGDSWKLITSRAGTGELYPWEVPWVTNMRTSCKVKIDLLDANGLVVGTDVSDDFFAIKSLNPPPPVALTWPNGGETLISGRKYYITWETNGVPAVAKAVLFYTVDAGSTWAKITAIKGNPGIYAWTVPDANSNLCKIKVVLKDTLGTKLASDISDRDFAIFH